eukprot:10795772-Lingulodinium_polyedra.AAC.1
MVVPHRGRAPGMAVCPPWKYRSSSGGPAADGSRRVPQMAWRFSQRSFSMPAGSVRRTPAGPTTRSPRRLRGRKSRRPEVQARPGRSLA